MLHAYACSVVVCFETLAALAPQHDRATLAQHDRALLHDIALLHGTNTCRLEPFDPLRSREIVMGVLRVGGRVVPIPLSWWRSCA